MSYISVSEEEGAEPIELPTEEDGTGELHVAIMIQWTSLTHAETWYEAVEIGKSTNKILIYRFSYFKSIYFASSNLIDHLHEYLIFIYYISKYNQ